MEVRNAWLFRPLLNQIAPHTPHHAGKPTTPVPVRVLQSQRHRGKNYMLPARGTYDLSPEFKYWVTMLYAFFPFLNVRLLAPLFETTEDKSTGNKLNSQVWQIMANGNAIRRYQRARAREKAAERGPRDKTPEAERPAAPKPTLSRKSTIGQLLAAAKGQGILPAQHLKHEAQQEEEISTAAEIVSLFSSFYAIPAVKFVDRMAMRVVFLIV